MNNNFYYPKIIKMSAPRRQKYVKPSLNELIRNEETIPIIYTINIVNKIRDILINYLNIQNLEEFKITENNTENIILQYLSINTGNKIYQLQKYLQVNAIDIYKLDTYFGFNLNTIFIAQNKVDALLKIDKNFHRSYKKLWI